MANKTVELKVLVDPDVRTQIDKVRGRVPMSTWLRDAAQIRMRVEEMLRRADKEGTRSLHTPQEVLRPLLEGL